MLGISFLGQTDNDTHRKKVLARPFLYYYYYYIIIIKGLKSIFFTY